MMEYSAREKGFFRPLWHFSAPSGWINDPNGFCFFKGYYHLFYQYNPNGCDWHEMHWGHARSKDLIHWEDLPIALYPDREYDSDPTELSGGCFSGSALVKGDRLYVFYTGTSRHGGSIVQAQCMAYSDGGVNFTKYEGNPIIPYPPATVGEIANFRDPRIVERDGKYYLLVAPLRVD